jgi:hypothetical protein
LLKTGSEIVQYHIRDENLTVFQKEHWEQRLQRGYKSAIDMLGRASKENKGLYLLVLWQWEDEEE